MTEQGRAEDQEVNRRAREAMETAFNAALISLREHVDTQLEDLQQQIDRRIETSHRELDDAKEAIGEQIVAVDRRLAEGLKQTQEAMNRATEHQERERERSASVMRENLERSREEGDDRLREHIDNQIVQIAGALESAEKLEVERIRAADAAAESVRRELSLVVTASKEAVIKAEEAQKEVNEKSNQYRAQLADQANALFPRAEAESRQSEQNRRLELLERGYPSLLTRSQFDSTVAEWSIWRARVEADLAKKAGAETAIERREDTFQPWQIWIAGAVVTIVVALIVVLANVATT